MSHFQVMCDYGDDETTWVRRVGDVYHVIRLLDLHSATGETHGSKYHVDLLEVDPRAPNAPNALKSCGPDFDDFMPGHEWTDEQRKLATVEAMVSYGASAPLESWSGNAKRPLVASARRESRAIEGDPERLEAALSRPVNAIGSTAREYAAGDIDSALKRGVAAHNQAALIMAKMQGALPVLQPKTPAELMDGTAKVSFAYPDKCRFHIFSPEHYRPDGSCMCDDPKHREMMIQEWEYSAEDFERVGL